MISILIISSEPLRLHTLSASIRKAIDGSSTITTTTEEEEALIILSKNTITFDIFVIDIQLKKYSGYMLEKRIRQYSSYRNTPVLFITKDSYNLIGFPKLATYQIYKQRNYISLPLDNIDIQGKIGLYLEHIISGQLKNDAQNKYIDLKTYDGIKRISPQDVLFLEIQNKICTIYTLKGKFIIKRTSLIKVLETLHNDNIIRCHRFFAINVKKVDLLEKKGRTWYAHFNAISSTCPISQTYFPRVNLRM